MRHYCINLILSMAIIVLFSACATRIKVDKLTFENQPKVKDCEIQFFNDTQPQKNYDLIAKIELHIKKNIFFGGEVQLEDEIYKELRSKACELGGDAVIIDDHIEISASEMTHVHAWATVVKFVE